MRKTLFFLILFLFTLSGCYQNHKLKDVKPADLIPENKMANIIRDMDVISSIVAYHRARGIVRPSEEEYYRALFDHYHVTAKQIRENMRYYNSSDDKMMRIYDRVLSDLSQMQSNVYLEKDVSENKLMDQQGIFNYLYKKQWIFYPDSVPGYQFKPEF